MTGAKRRRTYTARSRNRPGRTGSWAQNIQRAGKAAWKGYSLYKKWAPAAKKLYRGATRKTFRKTQIIKSPTIGLSNSRKSLKYKTAPNYRSVKAAGEPLYTQSTTVGSYVSTYGQQAANLIGAVGLGTSIKGWSQNQQGTQVSGQISKKIGITSYGYDVLITNQSPTSIVMTLYDCISKVTKVAFSDPVVDWSTGLDQQDGVSGITATALFPKAIPTQSKLFNNIWKIVKKYQVELAPGRTHNHKFNLTPNRVVDTSYAANFDQIKGLTYALMATAYGMPCDDVPAPTVGTTITLSPAKYSFVGIVHANTFVGNGQYRKSSQTNSLAIAPVGKMYIMDQDQGDPEDITVATEWA